ncbi:hypothetical protein [Bosea sp. 685]|uniref:hypothetical protein n=1 Tax=Bosea sp. 685 TaxID=3080057 RepID=UPI003977C977
MSSHAALAPTASGAPRSTVHPVLYAKLANCRFSDPSGLRTERRLGHVYAIDVPAYAKLLLVTDAVINIAPTLDQKHDICQNAIDVPGACVPIILTSRSDSMNIRLASVALAKIVDTARKPAGGVS